MLKKTQKSLLIAISVLASSATFSEPLPCPNSIEFDQHLQLPPTGYDAKNHLVKQIIVSTNSHNKNWLLFLNPLKTSPDDDTKTQITEALEQLNPVSATAYSKNLGSNQSNIQYCVYTMPKNPKLTAIAYYIEGVKAGNSDLLQLPKVKKILQSLQIIAH